MNRIKLDRILALMELKDKKYPPPPEPQIAVDSPVIGSSTRCWCGKSLGHLDQGEAHNE